MQKVKKCKGPVVNFDRTGIPGIPGDPMDPFMPRISSMPINLVCVFRFYDLFDIFMEYKHRNSCDMLLSYSRFHPYPTDVSQLVLVYVFLRDFIRISVCIHVDYIRILFA